MAYDSFDRQIILFGGYNFSLPHWLQDTWVFASGVWSQVKSSTHPTAREGCMMTYDPIDGYLLLFGGESTGYHNDSWAFKSGIWTMLKPLASPVTRGFGSAVFDSADGVVLVFGGFTYVRNHSVLLNDTWQFLGGNWTRVVTRIAPQGDSSFGLAYDKTISKVILFGGYVGTPKAYFSNQTWTYGHGTWGLLPLNPAPVVRSGPSICYDAGDGLVVLFGGDSYTGELSDTWYLS